MTLYEEAIHSLDRNLEPHQQVELVRLVAHLCHFTNQSGYNEKAVAYFQALIEFNCFCPPSLAKASLDQKLLAFEEFWDSGVPRFGEAVIYVYLGSSWMAS